MESWIWILIAVGALILLYAFNPMEKRSRKNKDLGRRRGRGMIEDFDEEQNFVDKYSQ